MKEHQRLLALSRAGKVAHYPPKKICSVGILRRLRVAVVAVGDGVVADIVRVVTEMVVVVDMAAVHVAGDTNSWVPGVSHVSSESLEQAIYPIPCFLIDVLDDISTSLLFRIMASHTKHGNV